MRIRWLHNARPLGFTPSPPGRFYLALADLDAMDGALQHHVRID
jgi:hypothetical protein